MPNSSSKASAVTWATSAMTTNEAVRPLAQAHAELAGYGSHASLIARRVAAEARGGSRSWPYRV
ncbi:hypothetical protein [Thiomonas sp. X19]|uniref:hypothetical protein n=1 Tax=Thiomonas sp. X19 TaxID=1050370 RepID=UPI0011BDDF56|nr:hypothetical protein [Thiomonas sp. X19]